jgi:hypothetical protein
MGGEGKKEYAKHPPGLNFSPEPAKVTEHMQLISASRGLLGS